MTVARKNFVDNETPGFYHCTNRCVRRTFLCGFDELTGSDFSHRKDWLEKRVFELADIFSVEIFAFAVMDNHYHLVVYLEPLEPQGWSDEQVAERWLRAYPGRLDEPENAKQRELKKQAIMGDKDKLKKYRKRLGSLSWFMGRLNEPLAKLSNQQDCCTGRFWEGRFSSQALLDEAAVFSCMAYVDLNPVRARITEKLEGSNNTSIKRRIDELKNIKPINVQAHLDTSITSLSSKLNRKILPMPLKDYIWLVEWTGKSIIYPNKGSLPANVRSSLERLNLQPNHWLKQVENFGSHYGGVIGPVEKIRDKAKQLKRRCLKGISAACQLYQSSS